MKLKDKLDEAQMVTKGLKETENTSRKRTKLLSSGANSSKDLVDLAQRRDVVNKTILRIIRRYFTQQFKLMVSVQYENKVDKQSRFFNDVRVLATKLFSEERSDFDLLHFYLASIIDHKFIMEAHMTSCGTSQTEKVTFYDCLYKYSHTRLVSLFEVKPIGTIYEYFYEHAKDVTLNTEGSVIKNKELYSQVLQEFLLIFQGKIDIATLII